MEMIRDIYKKGFLFNAPECDCETAFYEFVSYDEDGDMVHLKAHPKKGEPYDTQMDSLAYEVSFFIDDYFPLSQI